MSEGAPRRRFRIGYWIAGVASVGVAGLIVLGAIKLAEPVKFLYGFMTGAPSMPGCRTTIESEATVGPLWYRVVNLACDKQSTHMVFVRRGTGLGWFVFPALMTVGDPAPLSVRQAGGEAGTETFEIVLSKPLADGRTAVPIEFDSSGNVPQLQSFEHGRQRDLKAPGRS
jgi:hypothetical protein